MREEGSEFGGRQDIISTPLIIVALDPREQEACLTHYPLIFTSCPPSIIIDLIQGNSLARRARIIDPKGYDLDIQLTDLEGPCDNRVGIAIRTLRIAIRIADSYALSVGLSLREIAEDLRDIIIDTIRCLRGIIGLELQSIELVALGRLVLKLIKEEALDTADTLWHILMTAPV